MKSIKLFYVLALGLTFFSCSKQIESIPDLGIDFIKSDTSFNFKNYVVLRLTYEANRLDSLRNNSYKIDGFAKFENKEGVKSDAGNLLINNLPFTQDYNHNYSINLSGEKYDFGESFFGKKIKIDISGSENFKSSSAEVEVPLEIVPPTVQNLPMSVIDQNSNYPLIWSPDPNNEFHKVQIQLTYYKGLSRNFNSNLPNFIASKVYTVNDNGYFIIPKTDLYNFPVGSFIQISIARASTNNTGDIQYLVVADAHTIPIQVIALPPLSANFSLTTTTTNPCNFTATANVFGGKPSYGYVWSTYVGTNNQNATEIGYDVWVSGSGNCSTNLVNTEDPNSVPPDGPNDMYLQLKVTDANANSVIVVKKLKFSSGTGGGGGGGGGGEEPVQVSKK